MTMYHSHEDYGTELDPKQAASFVSLGDHAWVEFNNAEGTVYTGKVVHLDSTHIQVEDMSNPVAFADMAAAWYDEEEGQGYLFKMKKEEAA